MLVPFFGEDAESAAFVDRISIRRRMVVPIQEWSERDAAERTEGQTLDAGTKYNGPDCSGNVLSEDAAVWPELYKCLEEQENVCGEYYNLAGGSGEFYSLYDARFRAMAVQALRESAPLFEKIATTSDFIYFVQYYAGGGDDVFLALETVPEECLRALWGAI